MHFEIKNLNCGYGAREVITNFNASLKDGEILCILGCNGVGKTTIFKTILGFLRALGGMIKFALDFKEIWLNFTKNKA